MKLSTNHRFWPILLLSATLVIASSASPQSDDDNNIRFSRLLSSKIDALKFTSISNSKGTPLISRGANPQASYSMSSSSSSSDSAGAAAPSSASVAHAADLILQSYRAPLFEFSERSIPILSTSSVEAKQVVMDGEDGLTQVQRLDSESGQRSSSSEELSSSLEKVNLTSSEEDGILRHPVSRRGPVSVLQQITMGNKLNLTPLFAEPNKNHNDDYQNDAATSSSNDDDSSSLVTTTEYATTTAPEEYYDDDDYTTTTTAASTSTTTTTAKPETFTRKAGSRKTTTTTTTVKPDSARRGGSRSRGRGVTLYDNTTAEVKSTSSTTTPASTTTTTPNDTYQENLVIDQTHARNSKPGPNKRNNEINFPDFEDSPTNLATAESNQPARVNVRPASSGKEYEYEYIYYYYDDDDEDNSTSTTTSTASPSRGRTTTTPVPQSRATSTTQRPPAKVESVGIKGAETFAAEKTPSAKFTPPPEPSANHFERSRAPKVLPVNEDQPIYSSAEQESFAPASGQQKKTSFNSFEQDDYYHPQAVADEYAEPIRTNTRPILLKESNLVQDTPVEPDTRAPTPTRAPTTTTTTTTTTQKFVVELAEPVVTTQRSRFRGKSQFDSPSSNQFVPSPVADSPPEVEHRPIYKELTSRRIPQRRPEVQNPQDVSTTAQSTPQETQKLPSRTRFPPRISPTSSQEDADDIDEVAVYKPIDRPAGGGRQQQQEPIRHHQEPIRQRPEPVQQQETPVRQFPEPIRQRLEPVYEGPSTRQREETPVRAQPLPAVVTTTQPRYLDAEQENKAKENFARQKSINDLYALTRLHQLAINTRVPNRKETQQQSSPTHKGIPPKIAGGFISSSEVESPDNVSHEQRTYLPKSPSTSSTTSTSTTTEAISTVAPSEASSEGAFKPGRGRFRGRTRPTASSASSTTEAALRPVTHNRFAGRRRFPQPAEVTEEVSGTADPATVTSPQPTSVRTPGRNRFGARPRVSTARPTEFDTEQVVPTAVSQVEVDQQTEPKPRRQRPGFQNRRKPLGQPSTAAAPEATSENTEGSSPQPTSQVAGGEKRQRPNFARNRPNGGGAAGPLRPSRLRTSTAAPEPIEAEEEFVATVQAPSESPEAEEQLVSQKVTVSSSSTVSESNAEAPKRGSAGVLGRLRSRTSQLSSGPSLPTTTTTTAPPSPVTERKPSRLNGILNRRKNPTAPVEASPTNIVSQSVVPEEREDNGQEQDDAAPPKGGVIVQVSSVVSESQEIADHNGGEVTDSSTPSSILSRLKSHRKPGSLFRKRIE